MTQGVVDQRTDEGTSIDGGRRRGRGGQRCRSSSVGSRSVGWYNRCFFLLLLASTVIDEQNICECVLRSEPGQNAVQEFKLLVHHTRGWSSRGDDSSSDRGDNGITRGGRSS